jgi:hypothetical protein
MPIRCDKSLIEVNHSSDHTQAFDVDPQSIVSSIITDSGISETSETPFTTSSDRASCVMPMSTSQTLTAQQPSNVGEMGHSRNSSNTSQVTFAALLSHRNRSDEKQFRFRCRKAQVTAVASPIGSIQGRAQTAIQVTRGESTA